MYALLIVLQLFDEFSCSARLIGKELVEDSFLPIDQRRHQPLSGKGVAGGEKYLGQHMFSLVVVVSFSYFRVWFCSASREPMYGMPALYHCGARCLAVSLRF